MFLIQEALDFFKILLFLKIKISEMLGIDIVENLFEGVRVWDLLKGYEWVSLALNKSLVVHPLKQVERLVSRVVNLHFIIIKLINQYYLLFHFSIFTVVRQFLHPI